VVLKVLSLSAALVLIAVAPLAARQCKYREMQGVAGEKMTITAKIDSMEPDEDDPKTVWVTLDNSAADHCLTFLTGVQKAAVAKCKAGQQVTATGKVYERMDAWWGLNKVTGVSCK
jgi:RecG-like helicase